MCVRVCVRACVRACVWVCHDEIAVFSCSRTRKRNSKRENIWSQQSRDKRKRDHTRYQAFLEKDRLRKISKRGLSK